MLACAKIGAPHSVVYGGFSEGALADRIQDAQSRVLITQDGAWLRGKIIRLKDTVDAALQQSPVVETVVVVRNAPGKTSPCKTGRDYWWHELMASPQARPYAETEVMDAEDPLFILYTSGTTGKPKGVLHTHGGYQVYTSTTLQLGLRYQRGRPLVVRGRPRLDHRPFLHRLCAAHPGRDELPLRRRARLPGAGSLLAHDCRARHQHPLYRADRDPRPDALWRRLGETARPE